LYIKNLFAAKQVKISLYRESLDFGRSCVTL